MASDILGKVVFYAVLVLLVSFCFLGTYFVYWIETLILPAILAVPLLLCMMVRSIRKIIRWVTFPGSLWLFRRMMELDFGRNYARQEKGVYVAAMMMLNFKHRLQSDEVESLHKALYSLRGEIGYTEKIYESVRENRKPLEPSQETHNGMI